MADSTISALTAITYPPADADVLALVDTSATETKKVTYGEVVNDDVDAITVTGSLTCAQRQLVTLDSTSAIALTISGAPTVGNTLEIYCIDRGAVTHTVVLSGSVTWDGTNQTASFSTNNQRLRCVAISTTRWLVLENDGTVTFSA